MAKLVWRYSDDARDTIENVYKFCMEQKESGMELSLNLVWDRIAALTGVSRSTAQEIVDTGRAATAKLNHRYLRRKCHWMTLTRLLYGGPSPACTP